MLRQNCTLAEALEKVLRITHDLKEQGKDPDVQHKTLTTAVRQL